MLKSAISRVFFKSARRRQNRSYKASVAETLEARQLLTTAPLAVVTGNEWAFNSDESALLKSNLSSVRTARTF